MSNSSRVRDGTYLECPYRPFGRQLVIMPVVHRSRVLTGHIEIINERSSRRRYQASSSVHVLDDISRWSMFEDACLAPSRVAAGGRNARGREEAPTQICAGDPQLLRLRDFLSVGINQHVTNTTPNSRKKFGKRRTSPKCLPSSAKSKSSSPKRRVPTQKLFTKIAETPSESAKPVCATTV